MIFSLAESWILALHFDLMSQWNSAAEVSVEEASAKD